MCCPSYARRYPERLPDLQNERRKGIPVIAAARLNERIEPEREVLIRMVQDGLNT